MVKYVDEAGKELHPFDLFSPGAKDRLILGVEPKDGDVIVTVGPAYLPVETEQWPVKSQ